MNPSASLSSVGSAPSQFRSAVSLQVSGAPGYASAFASSQSPPTSTAFEGSSHDSTLAASSPKPSPSPSTSHVGIDATSSSIAPSQSLSSASQSSGAPG